MLEKPCEGDVKVTMFNIEAVANLSACSIVIFGISNTEELQWKKNGQIKRIQF